MGVVGACKRRRPTQKLTLSFCDDEGRQRSEFSRTYRRLPFALTAIAFASQLQTSKQSGFYLLQSTTGAPKLVRHSLHTLMGAIGGRAAAAMGYFLRHSALRRPADFLLRALSGRGSLTLGADGEGLSSLLARFGDAKITHISGTPTHWRKVLISG